jgi:hypothetical protein
MCLIIIMRYLLPTRIYLHKKNAVKANDKSLTFPYLFYFFYIFTMFSTLCINNNLTSFTNISLPFLLLLHFYDVFYPLHHFFHPDGVTRLLSSILLLFYQVQLFPTVSNRPDHKYSMHIIIEMHI